MYLIICHFFYQNLVLDFLFQCSIFIKISNLIFINLRFHHFFSFILLFLTIFEFLIFQLFHFKIIKPI